MENRTYRIILFAILGVIWILMCASCYLLGVEHGRGEIADAAAEAEESDLRSTVATKDNVDRVAQELEGSVYGPQTYEVIMNTEWVFKDGDLEASNAYVENSRDNENTVRFSVALQEQPDKVLFVSKELPAGSKTTKIKLAEALPKGRHKAVVTYSLLDDRGRVTGEVKAGVTLVAE